MKRYYVLYIIIIISAVFTATAAFSQEAPPSGSVKVEKTPDATPPSAAKEKEMSIYGEVQAVNAALGTLSVQYYDYDSDSEKTAEIAVGKDTKMENAKTLADIKKGDWADVTYAVSNGKNIARMVSLEKEEPAGGAAAEMPSGE